MIKVKSIRTVCTEVSGLSASMSNRGENLEEIELSSESSSELLVKGFTSKYVKDILKEQVIKQSKNISSLHGPLCKLIDRDIITPVMFTNNDDYGYLVEETHYFDYEKRIMGFYDCNRNRIFLILNNLSIGASGSIPNSSILSLIVHELMHYSYQNAEKDYKKLFNDLMLTFYKTFFDEYFFMKYDDKLISKYVKSLYHLESNSDAGPMLNALNNLLNIAQTDTTQKDLAFMNFKALQKLFDCLSQDIKNDVGIKISEISRTFFTESMLKSYHKTFKTISPELSSRIENCKDQPKFSSIFYQEFIASSEVAAILAGTLIKEMSKYQISLKANNPITKIIKAI
jgi:hypothetical protein